MWAQVAAGYGNPSLGFMEAPDAGNDTAGVMAAIDATVYAVRLRDSDRLRLASCDGDATCTQDQTQLQTRDQQRLQLASCVPAGAGYNVLGRTIAFSADGQSASVQVHLGVHAPGGAVQLMNQEWMFQRNAQGAWRLANVPACPFS